LSNKASKKERKKEQVRTPPTNSRVISKHESARNSKKCKSFKCKNKTQTLRQKCEYGRRR